MKVTVHLPHATYDVTLRNNGHHTVRKRVYFHETDKWGSRLVTRGSYAWSDAVYRALQISASVEG